MSSTVVEAIVPVIPLALFLSHTPSSGSIPDAPVPNLPPAVLARRWFCAELGDIQQGRRCDFAISCG